MFKILLPSYFEDKELRQLYNLITALQKVDWNHFYYGISIKEEGEPKPWAAGIPTSHGSITFWDIGYDTEQLLEQLSKDIPRSKHQEMKKTLSDGELFSDEIEAEVGPEVIHSTVKEHPEVVDYYQYDLLVPVLAQTLLNTDDKTEIRVESMVKKEISKLKGILSLSNIDKNIKSIFQDVELHLWEMRLVDPEEIFGIYDELAPKGSSDDDILEALKDRAEYAEEESEVLSYILILRGEEDADTTVNSLCSKIDQELQPLKGYYQPNACFVNLA